MSKREIRNSSATQSRPRHAWLYALPSGTLPQQVRCRGRVYRHVQTFKHDFFAATGLYRGDDGRLVVLKIGRTTDLAGLPFSTIGRFLARRESDMYQRVHDLPGVPRFVGRVGRFGLLHEFVPGHPLERKEEVSDAFFDELRDTLAALHARHIAYVDLNKRQNILMGDDGRPYLIDFQISLFAPPRGWRGLAPLRWLLRVFQQADDYHYLKHKARLRPDLLTPEERRRAERKPFWVRWHTRLTRPLTLLRRKALKQIAKTETVTVAGSSAK
ncbi:MAG: hypothetical protein D6744_14760 [Planctomycetota bacterium]|nr:MAG: hypothetical protein D6744_14760 [Planctomycetota bacterium]